MSCGLPRWTGVAEGTTLPLRGSVYVYDESLSWDGPPEMESPALGTPVIVGHDVMRIDYDAGPTGWATGTVFETQGVTLRGGWTAPDELPRVVQMWHHVDHWTCSYADSLVIQLDQPVAAVQARWTFDGFARELVVVPQMEAGRTVIELGKINCGRMLIDPTELASGGTLSLMAVRYDRIVVPISGVPSWISTEDLPKSDELMGRAVEVVSMPLGLPPSSVAEPLSTAALVAGALLVALTALSRRASCAPC